MSGIRHNVYRNLNKARQDRTRFVWSIERHGKGGKVEGHSTDVILVDVTFHCTDKAMTDYHAANAVHPKGKAPRKVFAKMRGTLSDRLPMHLRDYLPTGTRVSLNPHDPLHSLGFYVCADPTHAKITRADAVIFTVNGAYAINPR